MSALARRIITRAAPLLDARRRGGATWWEYAAAWSGTLLPLGAAAAFIAAACLVWTSTSARPARPHAIERAALLQVVTHRASSPALLDYVLGAADADAGAPSGVTGR
jgi:hypothetical protein